MTAEEERLLIQRSPTDPGAFGQLYDVYYPAIFGYVARRVGQYEAACDIVAETFVQVWRHMGHYQWRGVPFSAWLYRIASNELNQYFRRHRRQPTSLSVLLEARGFDAAAPESLEAEKAAVERELERHAEFNEVRRQLLTLPLAYQEVLALRYFEEKSIREISDITGRPEGTVKSLLARGVEKLRRALAVPDHAPGRSL